MTKNVEKFIAANDKKLVIIGNANPEGGGFYTLEGGKRFALDLEECKALPEGYPKWKLPDA